MSQLLILHELRMLLHNLYVLCPLLTMAILIWMMLKAKEKVKQRRKKCLLSHQTRLRNLPTTVIVRKRRYTKRIENLERKPRGHNSTLMSPTLDEKWVNKAKKDQPEINNRTFAFPHLYGFGFSDHRHVSYYTYRLIAPMLTMLLEYSLSMSNKNLSTPAFGGCSKAISVIFFDAILSRPIPLTQRANDFLLHI
jgi:hypothetical protein